MLSYIHNKQTNSLLKLCNTNDNIRDLITLLHSGYWCPGYMYIERIMIFKADFNVHVCIWSHVQHGNIRSNFLFKLSDLFTLLVQLLSRFVFILCFKHFVFNLIIITELLINS